MALTNAERQKAWRDRQRGGPPAERKRPKCGTGPGYQSHRHYKEDPCAKCREAWRVQNLPTETYTIPANAPELLLSTVYRAGVRGLTPSGKEARKALQGAEVKGRKTMITTSRRPARHIARSMIQAAEDMNARQAKTYMAASDRILHPAQVEVEL